MSTRALRYYEQRGLLTPRRRRNGYREYDASAVLRVLNIRALLAAGLNADSIRHMNACLDGSPDEHGGVCTEAIAVYEQRLRVVRERVSALLEVQRRLEEEIDRLRAADAPAHADGSPAPAMAHGDHGRCDRHVGRTVFPVTVPGTGRHTHDKEGRKGVAVSEAG